MSRASFLGLGMFLAAAMMVTAGPVQAAPQPGPMNLTTPDQFRVAACRLVRRAYPCTQYQQRCRMVRKCVPWRECRLLPGGRQCYTTRKCWPVRQCNMVPVRATCWRTYRVCN